MARLGVHIGQQAMTIGEMRALWRWLDPNVDWISIWDHFYEAPYRGGTVDHFEALTTLGALAADTEHARLGVMVFYVGYRSPGVLAKAASTIDHISNGRFELGLGAGWHVDEANAYGYDFPGVGHRLDMLDEATQIIRGLLTAARTTFEGRHFRVSDASCLPRPVQARLPIWIGGSGEKRTLRLTARHADGWNVAYVSVDQFRHLSSVLDSWCTSEQRDPSSVRRGVNLSFNLVSTTADAEAVEAQLRSQWGPGFERIAGGSLLGTPERAFERVASYIEAGADDVNIALRAPWHDDALRAYIGEVVPALRAAYPD